MESHNKISKEKEESDEIKKIEKFENLKSKLILKKVFNNLIKKKLLYIVKYNKNIKRRINININDYKEYSLIEIEMKPIINKFGEFINIKKENEIYYHIYFNNNKEEIKRNNIKKGEEIKIIKYNL